MPLKFTVPPSRYFPAVEDSDEDGLLCVGGDVNPNIILDALVHGIFPWPFSIENNEEDDGTDRGDNEELTTAFTEDNCNSLPVINSSTAKETNDKGSDARSRTIDEQNEKERSDVLKDMSLQFQNACWEGKSFEMLERLDNIGSDILGWWSPDPRAIMDLENIHVPKRLQRTMKSGKFIVTYDQAFPEVMIACATAGTRLKEGTWITQEFYRGYCQLFELGFAHSVECWLEYSDDNVKRRLVGGVYGVAINGFFDGESMFSVVADASKVALFSLLTRLRENGFTLFDLQILNPHTQSLGGIEISRTEYLKRLSVALQTGVRF